MSLHEEVLYPCVRVLAGDTGGSGTVIYSQQHEGEWHNYVLTCHHVVEKAVSVKEKWDAFLGRVRKQEERDIVRVEFFHYEHGSRAIGTHGVDADILMHDQDHDIALVRLRQTREGAPHVARLFPHERTKEIALLDPCYAVGCALLHAPIVTAGHITSMSDHIEGKSYFMSSAQIIFGNSGGAVFHAARNEFIGIPSRVAIAGWGSAVTHMGYFSDVERIYKVLDSWCYQFLYRPDYTMESCAKAREQLRREDLELQKRGFVEAK